MCGAAAAPFGWIPAGEESGRSSGSAVCFFRGDPVFSALVCHGRGNGCSRRQPQRPDPGSALGDPAFRYGADARCSGSDSVGKRCVYKIVHPAAEPV